MGQALELTIQQLLTGLQSSFRASELGLTAEQVAVLSEVAPLDRQKVSFDENGEMTHGEDNTAMQSLVSMIATIILFFFIITSHKSLRKKLLLKKAHASWKSFCSSTRAQTHYYAKLTGVIMVAATQLVAYVAIFGGSYFWIKDNPMVKRLVGKLFDRWHFWSFPGVCDRFRLLRNLDLFCLVSPLRVVSEQSRRYGESHYSSDVSFIGRVYARNRTRRYGSA